MRSVEHADVSMVGRLRTGMVLPVGGAIVGIDLLGRHRRVQANRPVLGTEFVPVRRLIGEKLPSTFIVDCQLLNPHP